MKLDLPSVESRPWSLIGDCMQKGRNRPRQVAPHTLRQGVLLPTSAPSRCWQLRFAARSARLGCRRNLARRRGRAIC